MRLIYYAENHSDLKRYLYTSKGLKKFTPLGLLNESNLRRYQSLPNDMNLTPDELVTLFDALNKHSITTTNHRDDLYRLDPNEILDHTPLLKTNLEFSLFFTRNSVREYERELKQAFLSRCLDKKNGNELLKLLRFKLESNEEYPSYKKLKERENRY